MKRICANVLTLYFENNAVFTIKQLSLASDDMTKIFCSICLHFAHKECATKKILLEKQKLRHHVYLYCDLN